MGQDDLSRYDPNAPVSAPGKGSGKSDPSSLKGYKGQKGKDKGKGKGKGKKGKGKGKGYQKGKSQRRIG